MSPYGCGGGGGGGGGGVMSQRWKSPYDMDGSEWPIFADDLSDGGSDNIDLDDGNFGCGGGGGGGGGAGKRGAGELGDGGCGGGGGGGGGGAGATGAAATGGGGGGKKQTRRKGGRADARRRERRVSTNRRKRIKQAVEYAMISGDSSIAAGMPTPEVLVDPALAARLSGMIVHNESVRSALRVLEETLFSGSVEVTDAAGNIVNVPREMLEHLSTGLNDMQSQALEMRMAWGLVAIGVRMEPVFGAHSGSLSLTPDGRGRMRPVLWVPQPGTYALTTWREGSRQMYNMYEFRPSQRRRGSGGSAGGPGGSGDGGGSGRGTKRLPDKMSRRAYEAFVGPARSTGSSSGVPGQYVLNPDVIILDHFNTSPNPLTGALTSRLAAAVRSFTAVEHADAMSRQWQERSLQTRFYIQEHERTASRIAETMIQPPVSTIPLSSVPVGASGAEAARHEASDNAIVAGPRLDQYEERARIIAASMQATERAVARAHEVTINELGTEDDRGMPGFAAWQMAAPGTEIKAFPPPPAAPHFEDMHTMFLQEALATIGVNPDLFYTRGGRQALGHVAVAMETFRQSMASMRMASNKINDEALRLARVSVRLNRSMQGSTRKDSIQRLVVYEDMLDTSARARACTSRAPRTKGRRAAAADDDDDDSDDEHSASCGACALHVRYPSSAYTGSSQLLQMYALGILPWGRFGAAMLRAAGMDSVTFSDTTGRRDPNTPEFRQSLIAGGATHAQQGGGGDGGGQASMDRAKKSMDSSEKQSGDKEGGGGGEK